MERRPSRVRGAVERLGARFRPRSVLASRNPAASSGSRIAPSHSLPARRKATATSDSGRQRQFGRVADEEVPEEAAQPTRRSSQAVGHGVVASSVTVSAGAGNCVRSNAVYAK